MGVCAALSEEVDTAAGMIGRDAAVGERHAVRSIQQRISFFHFLCIVCVYQVCVCVCVIMLATFIGMR